MRGPYVCPLHPFGHDSCLVPREPSRTVYRYQPPSLWQQVVDLKWEIAYYTFLMVGVVWTLTH